MSAAAVLHAVDAFKNPSRYRSGRDLVAPDGMLEVIKIAAGDDPTLAKVASELDEPADVISEAARHFLLLHLLDPRAQGVKMLGLNPGCSAEMVKEHKRWILKWLHPDRNPSKWESSLFAKVSTLKLDLAAPAAIEKPKSASPRDRHRKSSRPHGRPHMGQSVRVTRNQGKTSLGHQALFNIRPYVKSAALTLCVLISVFILIRTGFFDSTKMLGWMK
jgi:hypothetical protein